MANFWETYQKSHTHPVNKALHMIGIPMIVFSLILFFILGVWYDGKYGLLALGFFVLGWILQIVGHCFEGKPPAFLSNPIYLLIGPFWWIKNLLEGTKSKCANSSKNTRDKI